MDQVVLDFLAKERVCILAVALSEGTIHTAAMHFAYKEGEIYFSTRSTSKKASNLSSEKTKASITIGTSETDWTTLQMNGELEKIEESQAKQIILARYPEDAKHFDSTAIFLKFTPTWWRYSDYKAQPPIFIENK